MSSIIGKIAIWIGIVAQIYFSVVFVRMISINIADDLITKQFFY